MLQDMEATYETELEELNRMFEITRSGDLLAASCLEDELLARVRLMEQQHLEFTGLAQWQFTTSIQQQMALQQQTAHTSSLLQAQYRSEQLLQQTLAEREQQIQMLTEDLGLTSERYSAELEELMSAMEFSRSEGLGVLQCVEAEQAARGVLTAQTEAELVYILTTAMQGYQKVCKPAPPLPVCRVWFLRDIWSLQPCFWERTKRTASLLVDCPP